MEYRKAQQENGERNVGKDIRKGCKKVNVVVILCTYVCKW
jgi:hypothetical protein